MNITLSEARKAKSAYDWLRLSPFATLLTLFIVTAMSFGDMFCYSVFPNIGCPYGFDTGISVGIGVLVSGAWHLTLLRYVNDKDSEFVRMHGRKALTLAGIRTGVAFAGVILGSFPGGGSFIFIAVVILVILWISNASTGAKFADEMKSILRSDQAPGTNGQTDPALVQTPERERSMETNMDTLKQILAGLQSENDVAVFSALDKLDGVEDIADSTLKIAILKELEFLAEEDDNKDIQNDARLALNRFRQRAGLPAEKRESSAVFTGEPGEVLSKALEALQSENVEAILKAFDTLAGVNYSSEAARRQLEKISMDSDNPKVRGEALGLLNSTANRAVQKRINSNKLDRGVRYIFLQEIRAWEESGILDKHRAEIIRRRYDFDFEAAPQTPLEPAPAPVTVSTPQAVQPKPLPVETPAPVTPTQLQVPPEPRPSLLQTLTSEASIKIYLYLGAFFVIAAAAILGAVVPELRLPILIVATLIFGGLSIAIKKRLPQPSFALFIVFSFLLPITANSLAISLRDVFDFSSAFVSGYWAIVYLFMSAIWSGGTRLYESRFFSIAAFGALIISLLNIGFAFDMDPAGYPALEGLAALVGLLGVWMLKSWKDSKFALPLFLAAQLAQAAALAHTMGLFTFNAFDSVYGVLWNLSLFATWAFAAGFYVFSNGLYPFFAFPWLAAAAFIPMPWFILSAFQVTDEPPAALILFVWSAVLAGASEALRRVEYRKNYYLPALIASMPGFALALTFGFAYDPWLTCAVSLGIAALFTVLHALHSRWGLWTLALLNGVIAYFAFINLDFMQGLDIFFGYPVTLLAVLLLLPDLVLAKDWKANPAWRLPPRIYGALFTAFLSFWLVTQNDSLNIGVCYGLLAVFFTIYALAYRLPLMGYLPAAYLPLSAIFLLDAFNFDAWLPVLFGIAALYYLAGVVLRKQAGWASMLRTSGMALGVILSFTALILTKEYGGWYTLLAGFFFLAEMRIRGNGDFELGAPILFTSAAYLILNEFKIPQSSYHLLAYSLVWLFTDLLNHLTFPHPRRFKTFLRGLGALLTALQFINAIAISSALEAAIGFGIYTLAFVVITFVYRNHRLGYVPAASLPLTILFTLQYFNMDAWLLSLIALGVIYFLAGFAIQTNTGWSYMLRNSALILGSMVSIGALITLKATGGWYALVIGLLFIAEMYLRKNGWFEVGAPALFTLGAFLILRDFNVDTLSTHLLVYSLLWILADLLAHLTFANPRPLSLIVRIAGTILTLLNSIVYFIVGDASPAAIGFGLYALLSLTVSLVYRNPSLLYAFTAFTALFVAFLFRVFNVTQWIHPVIGVSALFYAAGFIIRKREKNRGWDEPLLKSGLGLGVIVSIGALILGGLDASIPVAIAATLWAVEAFARRNAWLAFPANGLYLLSYFILLFELNLDEPQFFSIGAALFGLIQHYLLTRAESKTGTFVMGMFSQFVLLGTTYIEMIDKNDLSYFFLLFIQSLVILVYGIVIRSRSLTFFPIGFVALGVVTVTYSALKDVGAIFVIGCTGILLLMLGVGAVLLRERIAKLGEKLSDWKA